MSFLLFYLSISLSKVDIWVNKIVGKGIKCKSSVFKLRTIFQLWNNVCKAFISYFDYSRAHVCEASSNTIAWGTMTFSYGKFSLMHVRSTVINFLLQLKVGFYSESGAILKKLLVCGILHNWLIWNTASRFLSLKVCDEHNILSAFLCSNVKNKKTLPACPVIKSWVQKPPTNNFVWMAWPYFTSDPTIKC